MPKNRALKVVAAIAASFAAFVGAIVYLLVAKIITFTMAKLMFMALLGLYVGFGFLIAVYRVIRKLE